MTMSTLACDSLVCAVGTGHPYWTKCHSQNNNG